MIELWSKSVIRGWGLWALFLLLLFCPVEASSYETGVIRGRGVEVRFEPTLIPVAKRVLFIYPNLKAELESDLGWQMDGRVTIILVKDRKRFISMSGSPFTAAFALPERRIMVLDYSAFAKRRSSLKPILKHELCHILIHMHTKNTPRWLNEGVCQWVGDGIDEIIRDPGRSPLKAASINGNFIPLSRLQYGFPRGKTSMRLAYEQSKSFVLYLINIKGEDRFLSLLNEIKGGADVETAFLNTFEMPLYDLESRWRESLSARGAWMEFLIYHMYEMVFIGMAAATVYAFIRLRKKRKNHHWDDEEDEDYDDE